MPRASELQRLAEDNQSKKVRLYNPDTDDFTVQFNAGDGVKDYTIHALEIEEYPYFVAQHIKKHLADRILHKRGIKTNAQDDLKKIREEIEVLIE